ncbi:Arabinose efflux permease [Gilliamella apicola]|uniref:MFS transporter n=1 Tax=Gilliamella apicola TaxID=1196095 RepID=UPI00042E9CD9|nr:MFS transporter [Gilliamella apicola]AHN25896.1 Arabinose efflux permease [Gilliamella apicola]PXV91368.1 putative MFS family arabinose efflux permease [Gilliamella apicola]
MSDNLLNSPSTAYWGAIFSLFIGVTSLIAAEFIPISLLTPIAQDLNITEGQAGQSVTMVGIFAVVTSLVLAPMTQNINRRVVLFTFSILLVLSNLFIAVAPNYFIMLIGRALLGICVGGFWSMASAVVLQLAPSKDIPRALSIVYAGVSVATIISLPLASYLGHLVGWRNVFFIAAALSFIALVWQRLTLPSLPPCESSNFKNMFALFKQNWCFFGIIGTIFSYGGYHLFFTYLRPFLEHNLALQAGPLTLILLVFGIANCIGTFVAGLLLGRFFRPVMIAIHLVLAAIAMLLFIKYRFLSSDNVTMDTTLVIAWGFMFGFIPVGWSTWITRTLADKAELVGGLSVAAIQFSIGLAAGVGGMTFDQLGVSGIFITATIICIMGAVITALCFSLYKKVTGNLA